MQHNHQISLRASFSRGLNDGGDADALLAEGGGDLGDDAGDIQNAETEIVAGDGFFHWQAIAILARWHETTVGACFVQQIVHGVGKIADD